MDLINSWSTGLALLLGLVSAYLAKKQGANPLLWFILGSFFGLFGVAWLFFSAPNKTTKTNTVFPPLIDEKALRALSSPYWYYLKESTKTPEGPVSPSYLQKLYVENKIKQNTLIWNEEFKTWKPLREFIVTSEGQHN